MRKIKKDSYYRSRGKVFKVLRICCAKCDSEVMLYQKDGNGYLHRLYLNRILAPEEIAQLQDNPKLKQKDLNNLFCKNCGNIIGIPMLHREGRLAFRLVSGNSKTKNFKNSRR